MYFAYKKILGRTETLTRDRIYCQMLRTVRDISRDDRARNATCSLRTPTDRHTDRLNVNYGIDVDESCMNRKTERRGNDIFELRKAIVTPDRTISGSTHAHTSSICMHVAFIK